MAREPADKIEKVVDAAAAEPKAAPKKTATARTASKRTAGTKSVKEGDGSPSPKPAVKKAKATKAPAAVKKAPAAKAEPRPQPAQADDAEVTTEVKKAPARKPRPKKAATTATPPEAAATADETVTGQEKPKTTPRRKSSSTAAKAPSTRKATASKASSGKKKAVVAASEADAVPANKPGQESAQPETAANTDVPTTASKPWLASYPDIVPHEIEAIEDKSLGDMLLKACSTFANRPAFISMGKELSYADLERASEHFAAFLQSRGLEKGARIALMMPNILQYPVALMGALRAGYVIVNVNPLYTPRELEHQLNDSGAEAIVILENFAATLEAVVAKTGLKHIVVASMGDMLGLKGHVVNMVVRRVRKMVPAWNLPDYISFKDAMKQGKSRTFRKVEVTQDDNAFLQYTGGTTGVSKGATLTHGNILANVQQTELWLESAYQKRTRPRALTFVCPLPLYHIYALTVNAFMGMRLGGHNILIANPRDIPGFVKELGKYQVNVFPGLNTLFNALLNNSQFQKLDFRSLLLTFGGGMAVQKGVADRWQQVTGSIISEGYGLSETSPVATANRFDADIFSGTVGLPIPSTEIAIRDDDGNDLPLGEVGEILIKGPQVMTGYWNRPDETAKVMTEDGFFKSGDMGFMDERGYIKIVDRKKDMILVSGFNVYPNEIEEVVAMHPGVLEVAAIGVPDEKSGEIPKVFVVKKDQSLTEQEIIDFCRDKLTNYKRPRRVEFRTELPKTNVGKILRRELR
ncbi:long-chain-fatty-acid--CoA ligase [Aquamicrobium zhengzhouense]|uniref:long-chain-fatty-acid--CoA ligase n=1 Tax=Aquamicrobium zhengzhouense TaxID=2781738 RepID=UPI001AEED394|nr:long-chain-fatty-acid--CoA ligase [Aquamicrobium zhengzhouense]